MMTCSCIWEHLRIRHACFMSPGPPKRFLSRHCGHWLQSSDVHPGQTPQRFLITCHAQQQQQEKEGRDKRDAHQLPSKTYREADSHLLGR